MFRYLNEWDRTVLLDYLMKNEEEAAFLIGNVQQFGITNMSGILRCGDYFGYFNGDTLKGVIAFYNIGNCFLHYDSEEAVDYFFRLMEMRRFSILLGVDRLIKPILGRIRHSRYIREIEECSYCVNKDFKPFSLEGIRFVNIFEDIDIEVINFIRKAYLNGFGAERSIEGTKLLLSQRGDEEEFIILSKGNRLMAQACIQTSTDNTSQIGAVYTLEEERGKGYGKAVVSELCERIIKKGKTPTLIVNKQNTPALSAYKALGFEEKDDYLIVKLYS